MRLLLDEMYAPGIAERLRNLGYDADSAALRADLKSAADEIIFDVAQTKRRVIVTNNVRDFAPLAQQALQNNLTFYGVIFTSDKSLPRSKGNIGTFVDLLGTLLASHLEEERLSSGVKWIA